MVLGDNSKENTEEQFILEIKNDNSSLFGVINDLIDEDDSYEINYDAFENIDAYRSI